MNTNLSYQSYLPYMDGQASHVQLNAAGWTKLLHEVLDEPLAALGFHVVGERIWADDYQHGRRKIVKLFLINDAFATLQWGWNFAYIPRRSGSKLVWCRTDKSIFAHTFRLAKDFYQTPMGDRPSVFGRYERWGANNEQGFRALVYQHQYAWQTIQPELCRYYQLTASDEGLLAELRDITQESYYNLIWPDNHLVIPFVEAHLGQREKALRDFEQLAFHDLDLQGLYRQKLLAL